jgi:hypothetical protein
VTLDQLGGLLATHPVSVEVVQGGVGDIPGTIVRTLPFERRSHQRHAVGAKHG